MKNKPTVTLGKLKIHPDIFDFINRELLAILKIDQERFWKKFEILIEEFLPRNRTLLEKREHLQKQIDQWHIERRDKLFDLGDYKSFLSEIGYLVPRGELFSVNPTRVDDEITLQAGAQLVVPVMNARFALNACNARWGSLYDALYGTDVIPETQGRQKSTDYNPVRGQAVIDFGRAFLNEHFPLKNASYTEVTQFAIDGDQLQIILADGRRTSLIDSHYFVGFQGEVSSPRSLLLKHHHLHVEIQIDSQHPIGKTDTAHISDIILESATTVIMDCEDSVAAVDPEDKLLVYRNWLGLMRGDLEEVIDKNGQVFTRRMNPDKSFLSPTGSSFKLPGRSLLFVRNVGHLMTSSAIVYDNDDEIPEGILDAVITSLAALFDLRAMGAYQNSRTGSLYIVKPKMHGPEEVAFTNDLFAAVEDLLQLEDNTLKIGIMDEERRTSVNLAECIRAAKARVIFINTGFLDRTGDEIHTSMEAGAFATKHQIKQKAWIDAYEKNNVAVGLACGLQGMAQIGKGMWAMPDNMAEMMTTKVGQLQAGANTAWVPSPTAATLHALHYHQVDIKEVQAQLQRQTEDYLDTILAIPLATETLSTDAIETEIKNNAQSILGYVVRWIDHGVGCSKVPDIHNVALMEDRATLRIASQLLSNWLHHHWCSRQQVLDILKTMAAIVDEQNKADPAYQPMAGNEENSLAFTTACDLIFEGRHQPNGYTEPLLHHHRQKVKSLLLAPK